MKPRILAVALSCLFSSTLVAQTVEFSESVNQTLSQNPQRDVTAAQIDQAQAALSQAEHGRMPRFNLSFGVTHSNNPLNVFGMKLQQRNATFGDFGFRQFDPSSPNPNLKPDDLNNPDPYTNFNTALEMHLPIWNGGRIAHFQQQAEAMLAAAQQGDVAVQQMLTYYVYEAYEGVHAARRFIEVAQQALTAAQAYVNTTQNLVNQGVVVRSELLSAQANAAEISVLLEQAQNQEQMALDGLRMLMGLAPNAPLDVGARVAVVLPSDDLDSLLNQALLNNPQLQAKRRALLAQQAAVGVARADLYPQVNMMARSEWNDDRSGFSAQSYTIGAMATWTFYDFGFTQRNVDQVNAKLREEQAQLRSHELEVRMQVLQAWRQYQNELKKLAANEAAERFATEAQELVARRYETGIATMTEVLASQAQLDKARAELVNSQYAINLQKARLRLATGLMNLDDLSLENL
ncbi:TolC family protein [Thiomicrospira cyclica]|uniref:Outer membrane efflux protein n=1 Tax=Thiomicrospira cyclica (strain DSM 14477 / JCM 11371 / ALM1) TaxID=717773 RepID=F6DA34_THICA|nr:TolC family protein [Thiomicrospira cyclica]AEG32165.1 outer membrane efflux protein [Thiomicrospira cyclica ALM1]